MWLQIPLGFVYVCWDHCGALVSCLFSSEKRLIHSMVLLVHPCHWLSGFRGFWLDKSEPGNRDRLIETSLLGCIESVHAIIRCFVSLRRSSWISPDFGLWCSGSHTHIHIPHIVEHYVCTFLKLNTPCVPNYIELSNNTTSGVATLLLGEGAEFVSPLRPIIINVAYQQRRKNRIFFAGLSEGEINLLPEAAAPSFPSLLRHWSRLQVVN